jgi:hypothetical protein
MAPERDFAPQKAEVAFFMDKRLSKSPLPTLEV